MRYKSRNNRIKDIYWGTTFGRIERYIIKDKFLFLPMTINGETRWFENVRIKYLPHKEKCLIGDDQYSYEPSEFIDEPICKQTHPFIIDDRDIRLNALNTLNKEFENCIRQVMLEDEQVRLVLNAMIKFKDKPF